ncbi:MoxR-like ATPase [Syntrophus gentianae]|uniref:MoxR-like ATPase n=1 Tax=Syntrophus gentianae TaxID=43775 RepID=A0A1H8AP68_9BACT|nr:MoxR family ATPase [Syntrophus gentianae]SEM71618.1 MoxR-like ATPase [Syntrophus gentianae]
MSFKNVADTDKKLREVGYISSQEIATVVFLAGATQKPVLVEGPAGVGKTELAKAVAKALKRELIRLQCYEGLDESKALYDWEYSKQLLYTQMLKEKIQDIIADTRTLPEAMDRIALQEDAFFSDRFVHPRPLLQAITSEEPVVLLIDEVDKTDPEFEAFLLELLSDFQVTIPEIGTKIARNIPFVFLTSNAFRELSDTLKRRCLYLHIDYPDKERELGILEVKFPGIDQVFAEKIVEAVRTIRGLDLKKKPCVSETVDWTRSLIALQMFEIKPEVIKGTLNVLCKSEADGQKIRDHFSRPPQDGSCSA